VSGKNVTLRKLQFSKNGLALIDEEQAAELKNVTVANDDILLNITGDSVARVCKVPLNILPARVNQHVAIIRAKKDKLIPDFLLYYLIYQKEELLSQSEIGATRRAITKGMIEKFPITLPPLPEQRAIASVLSSLDDKIDLLHRQNQTLEKMAETLFRQWFVEEAKEDWESLKIKDFDVTVTDFVANGSFASLAENVTYKSVPDYAILIRLTDFNNNFNGEFVYVDKQAYNFLNKSKLFGGEIIISNVGAYSGTVFKCPILNRPMTLGPNSIVLKSNFNNYFYLLFKSTYGKFLLDGIISGSAQPKFNKTAFRDIQISFPSTDYLIEFENLIKSYFDKIDKNIAQIRTLSTLRETLLPKLMSGEVRVEIV
jgi:type I restriction enzyme, S subunit